jgi:hypothetical protein
MPISFRQESFRDDFTFRNTAADLRRFPFPLRDDRFAYGVNVEPHVPGAVGSAFEHLIDIDEHYLAELRERALVLAADPLRCRVLPHMLAAQWDTLELLMTQLALGYPEHFELLREGRQWHWINRALGIKQRFTFADVATLPCEPLEYITRQAQGDFCLIDQRGDDLWLDGGMVTAPADWSLARDLGMNFMQWHAPVPMAPESRVFNRALRFLLTLQERAPVRRVNWGLTVNPRLDTSRDTRSLWLPDKGTVTPGNAGAKVHLRVELQSLWRLPRSRAILFSIRCYLLSLEQLASVPQWARRLSRVLHTLEPELIAYKGLTQIRAPTLAWLAPFDPAAATHE